MKEVPIAYTTICEVVDNYKEGISSCKEDPQALRAYLGLQDGAPQSPKDVSDNLYNKIRASFNVTCSPIGVPFKK